MEDHPELAHTRRHLGELGVMARQTEAAERQILARAEALLTENQSKIDAARQQALAGTPEQQDEYQALIAERGRLQRVIALARQVLGGAADQPGQAASA